MGYRLILCEKPDQGKKVANFLGATQNKKNYCEGNGLIVTWCIGHILETAPPEHYGEHYKKWSLETLPIIPSQWKLIVKKNTSAQFKVVKALVTKATEVIIATDADREGEMIAREVLDYCGFRGPVKRMWYTAINAKAVQKAWSEMLDGQQTYPKYLSALARSRADWLVGMNLSRLFTLTAQKQGYQGLLSVGRVQTPTLRLVVDRENTVNHFKPIPYWDVKALLTNNGQTFTANWLVPTTYADVMGRCIHQQAANQAVALIQQAGQAQVTTIETNRENKHQPLLFALSTLQAECSKRFAMGVQQTLDIAQALYEKHGLTTYPRSDCGYLPTDMQNEVPSVFAAMAKTDPSITPLLQKLDTSIKSKSWNDKEVNKSSHHGIIPTDVAGNINQLNDNERKVYELIRRYYLAQFLPIHEYDRTIAILNCGGLTLKATGKKIITQGWMVLMATNNTLAIEQEDQETNETDGNNENSVNTQLLPPLQQGSTCQVNNVKATALTTKPPALFTEGTLITAMKSVANLVTDPKIKQKLRETTGIGTEATRSNIISGLIEKGYIIKKKSKLLASEVAHSLIKNDPQVISDPGTTGLWEQALSMIEEGQLTIDKFLATQSQWISNMVSQYAVQSFDIKIAETPKCPTCGAATKTLKGKNGIFYGCSHYPNCKGVIFPEQSKKKKTKKRQ